MLNSKKDYIECLKKIIEPVKGFYTSGSAGIKCGYFGAHYDEGAELLEGFARILWGLAPLWAGGEDADGFDEIYLQGIINGTDPSHDEYWGEIQNHDQRMVETASIGLALVLAPHKVWEPLDEKQKENLHKWLLQMNDHTCCDNNWNLFVVLVNLGLKNVGVSYSKEAIEYGISRADSFYVGNGWYHDGITDQADYYISFAIHFYTLIYAKVMEKDDPEGSKKFKERSTLFAKDFIYWFAENGSALAFGRSLTYRFAQCCFWSACIFAGIKPFPLGVMKGIISRHIEWWLSQPIFDNAGILSVGYAYPNLIMSEQYNAGGSPYWALKFFLFLALPEDHEFFKAEILPLPELDDMRVIPEAYMTIQRFKGDVYALTSGQWATWGPVHVEAKYSKFLYSSKYAFSVPRSYFNIRQAASDNALAFEVDGFIYVRRTCEEHHTREDGTIYSKWVPIKGISVETELIPTKGGHIRKHTILSDRDCIAYDSSYAYADKYTGSIEGDGENITIACDANTNLMAPRTKMSAMKYVISEGKTIIETKINY